MSTWDGSDFVHIATEHGIITTEQNKRKKKYEKTNIVQLHEPFWTPL